MSWLIDLIAKLFGLWVNKTPEIAPVAEKAGAAEQKVKDQADAYDTLAKAADARTDADVSRMSGPGSDQVNTDTTGLEFRD